MVCKWTKTAPTYTLWSSGGPTVDVIIRHCLRVWMPAAKLVMHLWLMGVVM